MTSFDYIIKTNWCQLYVRYLENTFKLTYQDAYSHLINSVYKRYQSYLSQHAVDDSAVAIAVNNEDHLVLFEIVTRGYMDTKRMLARSCERERHEQLIAQQLPLNSGTAKQLQIDPLALANYLRSYVRNTDTRKFIYECLTNGVKQTQERYQLSDRKLSWKMRGIEQQFHVKTIKQSDVDMVTNYKDNHDAGLVSQLAMAIQFNNYDTLKSVLKANWDSDVCCDAMDVDEPIRMFELLGIENIHSTYQMVDNVNELMVKYHLNWDAITLGSDDL